MQAVSTKLRSIDLLGSPLHVGNLCDLLSISREALAQRERSYHFMALNPIKVVRAQREPELRHYLRQADVVYADAFGICLAVKLLYGISQPRIPGYELHLDLLGICQELGYRVYVLGGRQEVLRSAINRYHQVYPRLQFLGSHHGYFSTADFHNTILPEIQAASPELVLVAMGAVIQEHWIETIRAHTKIPLLLGIGGSLDAFIGATPRAPDFMLDLGCEWLYRLLRQPQRWRVMLALPVFAVQTLHMRLRPKGMVEHY